MNDQVSSSTDWAALARYLSGESDPREAEAIRCWIDASPERPALVEALRRVWAEAAVPHQEWDIEAALPRIMAGVSPARLESSRRTRPWRWLNRTALAAAAAAVLAVGLALWRPALLQHRSIAAQTTREYVTPRGQYATLVLVDGTRITLAPLSRLRVPRDLTDATRDVYLDGQALFKVAHDAKRVFRVHTARAVATDLGTSFVVRAYADAPRVEVLVTEGLVSLAATPRTPAPPNAAPQLLRPGDLGSVDAEGTLHTEHRVDPEAYTAWAEGRLVFRRAPLREVAAELSRWYDLEVRIADSAAAARRVTASFQDQPAPEVLRLIALSLELRYEQQGHTVILASREQADGVTP